MAFILVCGTHGKIGTTLQYMTFEANRCQTLPTLLKGMKA